MRIALRVKPLGPRRRDYVGINGHQVKRETKTTRKGTDIVAVRGADGLMPTPSGRHADTPCVRATEGPNQDCGPRKPV